MDHNYLIYFLFTFLIVKIRKRMYSITILLASIPLENSSALILKSRLTSPLDFYHWRLWSSVSVLLLAFSLSCSKLFSLSVPHSIESHLVFFFFFLVFFSVLSPVLFLLLLHILCRIFHHYTLCSWIFFIVAIMTIVTFVPLYWCSFVQLYCNVNEKSSSLDSFY